MDNSQIDRSVVETLRVLDACQSFSRVGVSYSIICNPTVVAVINQSDRVIESMVKTTPAESATGFRVNLATSWSLLRRHSTLATRSAIATGHDRGEAIRRRASLAAGRMGGKGLTTIFASKDV